MLLRIWEYVSSCPFNFANSLDIQGFLSQGFLPLLSVLLCAGDGKVESNPFSLIRPVPDPLYVHEHFHAYAYIHVLCKCECMHWAWHGVMWDVGKAKDMAPQLLRPMFLCTLMWYYTFPHIEEWLPGSFSFSLSLSFSLLFTHSRWQKLYFISKCCGYPLYMCLVRYEIQSPLEKYLCIVPPEYPWGISPKRINPSGGMC